jgi:hypothetical protein
MTKRLNKLLSTLSNSATTIAAVCLSGCMGSGLNPDSIKTPTASTPTTATNFVPSALSATGATDSIVLSWASVSGASSYNVYCEASTPVSKGSATAYSNVTSPYAVTGLPGGIPEYCAVSSVVDGVESALSSQITGSANLVFSNGQAASVVIGQTLFTSGGSSTTSTTLSGPWGSAAVSSDGTLYIADYGNNRVMGYNSIPVSSGAAADFVIGQTNFTNHSSQTTAAGLNYPFDLSISGSHFGIADDGNNRVLLFSSLPSTTNPSASLVLGQTSFTTASYGCSATTLESPGGVSIAGGKVVVADAYNNRVLIWNEIPSSNGQAADLVLGQTSLSSCNSDQGGINASTLSSPENVWTDGTKLLVSDAGNNRILVWNTFPTSNGQAADFVLGQPSFSSTATGITASAINSNAYGTINSNGSQIFFGDYGNNRVLIWNSFPVSNGAAADVVLGQSNFTNNSSATTSTGLVSPAGLTAFQNKLLVQDYGNNRVLVYVSQ